MSVNTDWDIEYYRTPYESNEHWSLKEEFMLAHKDRISEDRLVCLAQVYANIELLGCRYPDKTMEEVSILAQDIGKDYKEKKKNKLQRTFVKASDAAGARYKEKSKKNRPGGDRHQKKVPLAMKPLTFVKEFGSVATNDETLDRRNIEFNTIDMAPPQSCDSETIRKFSANKYKTAVMQNKKDNAGPSDFNASVNQFGRGTGQRKGQSPRGRMNVGRGVTTQKQKPLAVKGNHPLSNFLVVERAYTTQNSVSQLSQSAAFSHMPMTYTQSLNGREWFVSINGVNIGTGSGDTVKEAKEAAAVNALETLSHLCYTLKVLKIHAANEEVTLSEVEAGKLGPSSSAPIEGASLDKPVDNSSMGMKLLKLMGWTGGGLGKEGSGIIEPIKPAEVFGREGLGRNKETDVSVQFNNGIKRLISDYARGTGFKEIAFTADFSKEQRASIHKVARRFRLKTVSYGKGDDRYLVLSRKYSNKALIHKLLENGPTDKYQLIPPKDK